MKNDDPHPLIHRMRASGMSDEVIYKRLILNGWDRSTIDPIFSARGMDIKNAAVSPQAQRKVASLPHVPTLLGVLCGVLLCALGALAFFYVRTGVVYSISLPQNSATTTTSLEYGALPALSNPVYYKKVKDKFIEERTSFISADLSSMQLTVYVQGDPALDVPILAKGKVGSWWETPAGIYTIQTKEANHVSSVTDVSMPYSMQFQGNFFIHGWPTYQDGTPVATSYSGGCIRLSTEDARKVFALVAMGMPVVVYSSSIAGDSFAYQPKAPLLTAQNYLVADLENGTILVSANTSATVPIASITKLLTALVATEYINLDKQIVVPPEALVYTSVPRLKAGERVKAYDLLFLLLKESSNEAAEALAADIGRERFVLAMNKKAGAIGLANTHINDPSGAKEDISTVEDIFTLLRYVYANRRFVLGITADSFTDSAYGMPAFQRIANFNIYKNMPGVFLGGKVGQTNEAGETYAGVFSITLGGTNRTIAVIALSAKDVERDVSTLLRFVLSAYAPRQEH